MLFYLLSQGELSALLGRLGYTFGPDAYRDNVRYYSVTSEPHGDGDVTLEVEGRRYDIAPGSAQHIRLEAH